MDYGPIARASFSFPGKTRDETGPTSKDASSEDPTSKPGLQMIKVSTPTFTKHSLTGHNSFARKERVESKGGMLVSDSRQMHKHEMQRNSLSGRISFRKDEQVKMSNVSSSTQMQEHRMQRHGAVLLTPV